MRYKQIIFNMVVPTYLQEVCSNMLYECLKPQIVWNNTYTMFFFYIDIPMIGAFWVAQLVKNLPAMQETPIRFLGREVPLEKG